MPVAAPVAIKKEVETDSETEEDQADKSLEPVR